MKFLPIFSAILLIASISLANDTTYSTRNGDINVNQFENELSYILRAEVNIDSIKWPLNPVKYILYTGRKMAEGPNGGTEFFVVDMTIDSTHTVSCNLTVWVKNEEVTLSNCKSDTALFPRYVSIIFERVGLPPRYEYGRPDGKVRY